MAIPVPMPALAPVLRPFATEGAGGLDDALAGSLDSSVEVAKFPHVERELGEEVVKVADVGVDAPQVTGLPLCTSITKPPLLFPDGLKDFCFISK